jgi:hypothetical protein
MHSLNSLRKQMAQLQSAIASLPQPATEREGDMIAALAALCAFTYGEQDPRANVDHLRSLSSQERQSIYVDAMSHAAGLWVESEEGQRFKALPYSEQVALGRQATRRGDDILLIHGMRRAMRGSAITQRKLSCPPQ